MAAICGVHGRNLHGDVLAQLGDLVGLDALNLQVDQHADLAAHVDVGHVHALGIADEAADLDVLADGQHLVGGDVGHGAVGAGVGAGLQGLHVGGILVGHDGGQVLHESFLATKSVWELTSMTTPTPLSAVMA